MSENMLTIDRLSDFTVVELLDTRRLSDFTVVGLLDTRRLSDVGVIRALSRAIYDRLSGIGMLEGSNQTPHPTEYLTLLCLRVVELLWADGLAVKNKRADFLGPLVG